MKYSELAGVYEQLEKTSKRLEKTEIISELLKRTSAEDLEIITLLIEGRIFPNWDEREIGVASRSIIKAISAASGINALKVEDEWRKTGDLGIAAERLIKTKKQTTLHFQELTVKKVFDNLRKLAELEGLGTVDRKIQLIAELLTSAKPNEARYIVRAALQELRVGVGAGSLRDAICWAFFSKKFNLKYEKKENNFDISDDERVIYNQYIDAIQRAYDLTNDFSSVAKSAKEGGLDGLNSLKLKAGNPINVMLYQKAKDIEEGFETVGKPAALEYKYDGFRMQMHNDGKEISLFTRRLEKVTKQFPDVVEILKTHVKSKKYILDAEIIGIDPKTKKWLPFQNISQRIKRKYDIGKLAKDVPIMVNVFDVMMLDGKNTIETPFAERRDMLRKAVKPAPNRLNLANEIVTDDLKLAEEFYKESLKLGNEGIMMKSMEAPYKPGSRVGYGVKIKPTMENVDVVIVGAEWGEGKRANWLSSFTIACSDEGKFREIGKVGTGIKEKTEGGVSFEQLTKLLKPLVIGKKGKEVKVKPKIVIEVSYEEIQKSPTYESGFALRFPRVKSLRTDMGPKEISTLNIVKDFYNKQKKK